MLVRVAAARALARVIRDGLSLNVCLAEFAQKVPEKEQSLLSELCYGTLRQYPAILRIVARLLDKPLKEKDSEILALVACALYQLTDTRIPDHAVVNESVAACVKLKRPWAKGLTNAALRRFIRERHAIETVLADDPEYVFAHPNWLIEAVERAWPMQAREILTANNQRAPMTLRVNALRTTRGAYLSANFSQDTARATGYSDAGVQLRQPAPVTEVAGFSDGLVSVQDEAAQLAAVLLEVKAGHRVLDACCAPGGKTCHILEATPTLTELVAIDIDPQRLEKVRENLHRLKLKASLVAADVIDTDSWWDGALFDRVLLDAPCSASGVIRRHPDIKLLRKPEDIDKLAELQLAMLTRLWPLLNVGGKLLYATCSVLPAENDAVVERFMDSVDDAEVCPVATEAGSKTVFGRQLFPVVDGHDGFYYALLEKIRATENTRAAG
tara:strand:- start:5641 stop:6963 length:1323 start_codon:yes stop_codon:yes gene_type:complete